MRSAVATCLVVLALLVWAASSSQGDPSSPAQPGNGGEPITGSPKLPVPGSETPRHDPFTTYSPGDPSSAWDYAAMSEAERAVIDHARTQEYGATNEAYAAAARRMGETADGEVAADQLGVDNLATTGVVP